MGRPVEDGECLMLIVDHDDRLVVLDDEAAKVSYIWQPEGRRWAKGSADFARKAWVDGTDLTEAEAKERFPSADWENLPDLEAA